MNKQPSQPDAIELLPGMACTKADLMKRIRDQLRVPVIAGADQRMERIDGRHGKRRHRRVDLE
jgi:Glycerol-3-phosphate responsive antiterminator (mRNA-binding)